MTTYDDDDSRRRHSQQQQQQQLIEMAHRREMVEEMHLAGLSNRSIARELGVDEQTVRRDLQVIKAQMQVEQLDTLGERLATSVARRLHLYTKAVVTANSKRAYDKDKVLAIETANKILNDIDRLQGTQAPDSLNSAALAEVFSVLEETLAAASPELQQKFAARLQERLSGGGARSGHQQSAGEQDYDGDGERMGDPANMSALVPAANDRIGTFLSQAFPRVMAAANALDATTTGEPDDSDDSDDSDDDH